MSAQAALPPSLERHELKYLIPHRLVEPLSRFLAPWCELDHHSVHAPDHFYQVNSLYFDTRDKRFLRQRMDGADSRFNMRARVYGEGDQNPLYLEIKHRQATISRKFRAELDLGQWPGVITDPHLHPTAAGADADANSRNLALFQRLATSYAIEPQVYTQYQRRAFFSTVDDYARVTMDRCMRMRPQGLWSAASPWSLQPDSSMIGYDNETIYGNDCFVDANVVLELKCQVGFVPLWMVQMVRRFELKQVGFSKYMNATLVGHLDNGEHFMCGDLLSAN